MRRQEDYIKRIKAKLTAPFQDHGGEGRGGSAHRPPSVALLILSTNNQTRRLGALGTEVKRCVGHSVASVSTI